MPSTHLFLFFCLTLLTPALGQQPRDRSYFDVSGKRSIPENAYYYRTGPDSAGYYTGYYNSSHKLYFKGKISDASDDNENLNVYEGLCQWYFKNGNLRLAKTYDEKGGETGITKYYYESGKIWKELEFENGRLKDNSFTEYNEDGSRNRIMEDHFDNNHNDWDLYMSDKSSSGISSGLFELTSFVREGTSRFINHAIESDQFSIEAVLNIQDLTESDRVGIIFGFKDWQNYNYFAISNKALFIGSFYEGVKSENIAGMYCSAINPAQNNSIKIISNGEKDFYSVNGEIQYKEAKNRLIGNNLGFVVSGKAKLGVDKFVVKQIDVGTSARISGSPDERNVKATGSGILFSTNGYIITNHHVIENSTQFVVDVNSPEGRVSCKATLVLEDKENDLAILKIKDDRFKDLPDLRYSFKETGLLDVGGTVFTIGYPHALSGMGREAKFSDGKISSKTGFNGNINSFQTTIPVQPGNSGGPVFNETGQLVGVINATFKEADNVSYVIKLNYIKNLIELINEKVDMPADNSIGTLSLEEKLKVLTNYVVLIKVK